MELPIQITFRGLEPTDALRQAVEERAHKLERFFDKIKHYRAIATRFDKHDANYMAAVKLAALRIWMRFDESVA